MNWLQNKNRTIAFMVVTLFVVTGTYNAVVINSESYLASTDIKFAKRLDEIYGVTVSGREVAASVNWKKIGPKVTHKPQRQVVVQKISEVQAAPEVTESGDSVPTAAVQEDLSLSLVEVINPKKWQQGLPNTEFTGSLVTNNGVIESLSVSLPQGEGVSVSFSEMTGNVFEYDLHGQLYSGMMYQVDQGAYMVTLSNGPLEGTRMRFQVDSEPNYGQAVEQTEIASNNAETDTYGNNSEEYDSQYQAQTAHEEAMNNQQELLTQNSGYGYGGVEQTQEQVQNYDQQMQEQAIQAQQANF